MNITIQVKPNSRKEGVEELSDGTFVVRVNVPPTEGRANERVIELLAEHFKRPKSNVTLVLGHKNKRKVIKIAE